MTLSLAEPADSGQMVTVSYEPIYDRVLMDASGNRAPPFREFEVTNGTAAEAVAPRPLRARLAGTLLTVEFDGALNEASRPAGSDFRVAASDADDSNDRRDIYGIGTATVAGPLVKVTLPDAVPSTRRDTAVTYFKEASAPLQGAGEGNPDVPKFEHFSIKFRSYPARLESVATEEQGRGLWLAFTKDVLNAGVHTDYTVMVDNERRETRQASREDNKVRLLLAEPVRPGETVTVAYANPNSCWSECSIVPVPGQTVRPVYTMPAGGVALRDVDGLAIESFGPERVDVGDGRPAVSAVALTSAPTMDAEADGTPDTYGRGETVEVTVTWNADVTWDLSAPGSRMRVRLDVGGAMKGADLVTGGAASGTARSLAFRYNVHRTDAAPDGLFPAPAADGAMVVLVGGATLKGADGPPRAPHARGVGSGPAAQGGRRPRAGAGRAAGADVGGADLDADDRRGRRRRAGHLRARGDGRGDRGLGRGRDLGPVRAGVDAARAARRGRRREGGEPRHRRGDRRNGAHARVPLHHAPHGPSSGRRVPDARHGWPSGGDGPRRDAQGRGGTRRGA